LAEGAGVNKARRRGIAAVALLGALLLAACSSSSGSGGGGGSSGSSAKEVSVGFPTAADYDDLMTLMSIKRLAAKGVKIKPVFFKDPETAFAAASRGDVQLTFGAATSALQAIGTGAKLKIIGQQQGGAPWAIVGRNGINSCDDLVGKRFALNSPGGTTTGYSKFWIGEQCSPDAQKKVRPIYIPDSGSRAAALVAGQIDATILTPSDIQSVDAKAAGKFHTVVDFAQTDLKQLNSSMIAVNQSYLNGNRDAVVRFMATEIKAYNDAKSDPTVLQPLATGQQLDWSDQIAQAIEGQFQKDQFTTDLKVTPETLAFTIKFFSQYGDVDASMDPASFADYSVVDDAAKRPSDAA
jgi:ABC-type nitrate/sulfonate/bicarbonate transport system substrate-binding protein